MIYIKPPKNKTKIAEIANITIQIGTLQDKTLEPSNGGIGNKLKAAKKKLILVPIMQVRPTRKPVSVLMKSPRQINIIKNIKPKAIFTSGPAIEIIPFVLLSIPLPYITTAPGAANINPKNELANAIRSPIGHNSYSA